MGLLGHHTRAVPAPGALPYFDLYRKQVVKQADLVLAMHLRGEAFTAAQKACNFAYYERLTVRDSSLSTCTQAVLAAAVGHLDVAHDYLAEAALMDLNGLERNTRDGLHIASLAGAWIALVAGFGGMRERDHTVGFAPRLPPALSGSRSPSAYKNGDCPVVGITRPSRTHQGPKPSTFSGSGVGRSSTLTAGLRRAGFFAPATRADEETLAVGLTAAVAPLEPSDERLREAL